MSNLPICLASGSRRPSGLRKTKSRVNSLAHRTTWLRSDLRTISRILFKRSFLLATYQEGNNEQPSYLSCFRMGLPQLRVTPRPGACLRRLFTLTLWEPLNSQRAVFFSVALSVRLPCLFYSYRNTPIELCRSLLAKFGLS